MWVNAAHIITIKKTTGSTGNDGILRNYVVTLSQEAEPNKDFNRVWASKEEAKELLEFLNYKPSSDDDVPLVSKPKLKTKPKSTTDEAPSDDEVPF